ncbi:MAG: hypothetical protein M1812_007375 [Candelaria pacifica]|nr:MAG: hypothetical protein M1812_007375 [Candelaria pacifica]
MLVDVSLPFYPSAVNGMTWSKDGELAIAAGEHVYVLIPKLGSAKAHPHSRPFGSTQWDVVRFRVNVFTIDEVAILEPADSETLSLGEEQSTSTVVSLVWSPPGVGKHRRSVLAILTSNNVLSVWGIPSYPNESRSWNRSLIINHEIANYFERLGDLAEESKAQQYHVARLRRRIRAVSWSHPCCLQPNPGSERPCDVWGVPLLAVTNDNLEIIFLQLQSPHYPSSAHNGQWRVDVLGHVQVSQSPTDGPQSNSLIAIALRPVRFVSHVAWSPWIYRSDGAAEVVLVYLLGGRLLFRKIRARIAAEQIPSLSKYATLSLDMGESEYFSDSNRHRLSGPLLSHDQTYKGGVLFAAATYGSIITIFVRTSEANVDDVSSPESAFSFTSHNAEEVDVPPSIVTESKDFGELNWDRVSCIILEDDITGLGVHIHIVSHLTNTESFVYTVHDNKASIKRLPISRLGDQLAQSRYKYYVKYHLDGPRMSRLGGSSFSTTGGYIATSFSVHAGDMPEYVTVAKENSTVSFLTLSGATNRWTSRIEDILGSLQSEYHPSEPFFGKSIPANTKLLIPDLTVSAEGLVFKLLHCNYKSWDIFVGNPTSSYQNPEHNALSKLKEDLRLRLKKMGPEASMSFKAAGYADADLGLPDTGNLVGDELATQSIVCSRICERLTIGKHLTAMRLMKLIEHAASLKTVAQPPDSTFQASAPTVSNPDPFTRSLQCRLVESILEIPNQWARNSAMSKKIKYAAACAATLGLGWSEYRWDLVDCTFDWLAVDGGVDFPEEREHLAWLRDSKSGESAFEYYAAHEHSHTLLSKSADEILSSNAQDIYDICEICGAGVGWDSLTGAQCHSGHTFRRCALTFLAIQAPGISKYCGLCGIEYLHLDFLLKNDARSLAPAENLDRKNSGAASEAESDAESVGDEAQDTHLAETPVSLAQILSASCEICIYCGGKFVG